MNRPMRFDPPHRPLPEPRRAEVHDHDHDQIYIPKPIMMLMAALVLFTIGSVLAAKATGIGLTQEGELVPEREVVFSATGEGFVGDPDPAPLVALMEDGTQVMLAEAGEEVFPRLILRGIASKRASAGIATTEPIRLFVMPGGQRLLVDESTGNVTRLSAFGPENGRSFDSLLAGDAS